MGFGACPSNRVTSVCVGVAGFGTTQVELLHRWREKFSTEVQRFLFYP